MKRCHQCKLGWNPFRTMFSRCVIAHQLCDHTVSTHQLSGLSGTWMAPHQHDGSLKCRHNFKQSQSTGWPSNELGLLLPKQRHTSVSDQAFHINMCSSQDHWLHFLLPPTSNIFFLADSLFTSFFRNLGLFLRTTHSWVLVILKAIICRKKLLLVVTWLEFGLFMEWNLVRTNYVSVGGKLSRFFYFELSSVVKWKVSVTRSLFSLVMLMMTQRSRLHDLKYFRKFEDESQAAIKQKNTRQCQVFFVRD